MRARARNRLDQLHPRLESINTHTRTMHFAVAANTRAQFTDRYCVAARVGAFGHRDKIQQIVNKIAAAAATAAAASRCDIFTPDTLLSPRNIGRVGRGEEDGSDFT